MKYMKWKDEGLDKNIWYNGIQELIKPRRISHLYVKDNTLPTPGFETATKLSCPTCGAYTRGTLNFLCKTSCSVLTVCSHILTLFWLRNTPEIVETYQWSFRFIICAFIRRSFFSTFAILTLLQYGVPTWFYRPHISQSDSQ